MVILPTAACVGSAVEAALIRAVVAPAGAVYVVAAPLAVCVGLKEPQVPTGLHVQSTPAFVESLATTAVSD